MADAEPFDSAVPKKTRAPRVRDYDNIPAHIREATTHIRGFHRDEEGKFRDQWDRYVMPHPETGEWQSWTRATTFAKYPSDTFLLDRWGLRLALKGLVSRPDLMAMVAATSLEDKGKLNDLGDQCKEAMASSARARLGTALHKFTEDTDRGEGITAPHPWRDDVLAYVKKLEEKKVEILPEYIELTCVLPNVGVAGTFDRIVRHRGELVIGDLKTGDDLSYGWGEIATQLAIYANATHIFDWDTLELRPMPEVSKTRALIFHLPVGEAECNVEELDIVKGAIGIKVSNHVGKWRKIGGFHRRL